MASCRQNINSNEINQENDKTTIKSVVAEYDRNKWTPVMHPATVFIIRSGTDSEIS